MQKSLTLTTTILAVATMLASSQAQTPAATPPAKPKTAASAATKPSTTAKKSTTTAKSGAPALALKTQKDKFSYALGMNLGTSLQKQSVPVDPAILARGLRDALAGKTQMTDDDARAAIMAVQTEMRKKMEDSKQAMGGANKKQGDAFLAANKAKEGVTTLPSGLQYKILTAGTGPKPTATDSVVCNYRGTLLNGKEFDSSYKRGQPATFPVNGVIKGWTEALQLMPVGSKWQLFVPADLAYGDRGAGADIGPGATLIFEVELMSIQDKSKDATPPPTK
jgi:FKBP-type peptidyl-prolyl cis-trans isomerase FklB